MANPTTTAPDIPELKASDMLCPCYEFTAGDLEDVIVANPALEFDEILKLKNIGNKCTACLLDLEYHYIEISKRVHHSANYISMFEGSAKHHKNAAAAASLKQKIYNVVDNMTPMVHPPESTHYYLPVIRGTDVEQFVWIANRSFLFEGKICAPPMTVELRVRDMAGRTIYRGNHRLEQDSDLRLNVSQYLPAPAAGTLSIGSVCIARKADKTGYRGTTRPQIELVGTTGAACVHGQAPSPTPGWKQTFLCRPGEERVFFATVNASSRPMKLALTYPLDLMSQSAGGDARTIDIPPFGATLQEIVLDADQQQRFLGQPYSVLYQSASRNKTFVLCADPKLTAFSVDHA